MGEHIEMNSTVHTALYILKWHGTETIFLLLMFILAFIGNILVLYIYQFQFRRSNFSFFIKVLAALDLINASITIPLFLVITLNDQIEHFGIICKTSSCVAITTVMASAVVLVVIAYDRNRNIRTPLKKKMTVKATKYACVFAVACGIMVAIPSIFLNGRRELEFGEDDHTVFIAQCYFTKEMDESVLFWAFLVVLSVVFLTVVCFLSVFYCSIYKALKVHTARRPSTAICDVKTKNFRSHKTTAKIFFAVTVAFFCSYFPYFIAVIVFLVTGQSHILSPGVKAITDIAKLSPLLSNAINPVIYSVSSRRFRLEVLRVFRCGFLKRAASTRGQSIPSAIRPTTSSIAEME